jgi:hypothetical protein
LRADKPLLAPSPLGCKDRNRAVAGTKEEDGPSRRANRQEQLQEQESDDAAACGAGAERATGRIDGERLDLQDGETGVKGMSARSGVGASEMPLPNEAA